MCSRRYVSAENSRTRQGFQAPATLIWRGLLAVYAAGWLTGRRPFFSKEGVPVQKSTSWLPCHLGKTRLWAGDSLEHLLLACRLR